MLDRSQFVANCNSRKVYQNTDKYPQKPKYPAVLNKTAAQLSMEDILVLPNAKAEYETALKTYQSETKAWKDKDHNLLNQFWADMNEVFGLDDSKFADSLRHLAWERGHANGLGEVASEMSDLVELWELYKNKGA